MRFVLRDQLKDIIMITNNKRYVLTSETNMWVIWKENLEGHLEVHEIFPKSEGYSRYDNKNKAILKMMNLEEK